MQTFEKARIILRSRDRALLACSTTCICFMQSEFDL